MLGRRVPPPERATEPAIARVRTRVITKEEQEPLLEAEAADPRAKIVRRGPLSCPGIAEDHREVKPMRNELRVRTVMMTEDVRDALISGGAAPSEPPPPAAPPVGPRSARPSSPRIPPPSQRDLRVVSDPAGDRPRPVAQARAPEPQASLPVDRPRSMVRPTRARAASEVMAADLRRDPRHED